MDVLAVAANDRRDDPAIVRVAHELGLPDVVLGSVAFLDILSLGSEVLARSLTLRAARLDVHDDAHSARLQRNPIATKPLLS